VLVALVIQHARRMRRIILSSVVCPAVPYFCTFSDKRHNFRKNVIGHKMGILITCTILSEIFFILRRIHQYLVINVPIYSCKVPIILFIFEWNLNFLDRYSNKILKYQISRKSFQREPSCSMLTGRQIYGHDEANSRFSQFCECASKGVLGSVSVAAHILYLGVGRMVN
jgi:hypothetical protein